MSNYFLYINNLLLLLLFRKPFDAFIFIKKYSNAVNEMQKLTLVLKRILSTNDEKRFSHEWRMNQPSRFSAFSIIYCWRRYRKTATTCGFKNVSKVIYRVWKHVFFRIERRYFCALQYVIHSSLKNYLGKEIYIAWNKVLWMEIYFVGFTINNRYVELSNNLKQKYTYSNLKHAFSQFTRNSLVFFGLYVTLHY